MNKIRLYLVLALILAKAGFSQELPVFINLVSHNEDTYQHYINIPNAFYASREKMIDMAQLCLDKDAKWHLGTDWILPVAVLMYDTGSVRQTSDNKNVLKYISENLNVAIDAHSHEKTYNYTDVAHLLDSAAVQITPVMSGFLWNQAQNGHYWFDYQNPVAGDSFPHITWRPEILWGAGTPGHVNDPDYIGIWRPADTSPAGFFTHDPDNHLINYGQGWKMRLRNDSDIHELLTPLRQLLYVKENGIADPEKIYCTSIFLQESELVKPFFIQKARELIDSVNCYAAEGRVKWMRIDSVVHLWKTRFNNIGSIQNCDDWPATGIEESHSRRSPRFSFYPNPSKGNLTINIHYPENRSMEISIVNIRGQTLYSCRPGRDSIFFNGENLPNGLYFLLLKDKTGKILDSKKWVFFR